MTPKHSTKSVDLDKPAAGMKVMLSPGNHKIKILSAELRTDGQFGDRISLLTESEPVEGNFLGMLINKNDPTGPRYKGRVGYIELSKWPYKDWTGAHGSIYRDEEMIRALGLLCRGLGISKWYESKDCTADELVNAFIQEQPFKDIFFYCVIAGREYIKDTYTNYNLYFPANDRNLGDAFSLNKDRVQKFFESSHIDRLKNKAATTLAKYEEVKTETGTVIKVGEDGPVKITPSSQVEANFLNDAKKTETQTNADFLAEMNATDPEQNSDIVVSDDTSKLPWE